MRIEIHTSDSDMHQKRCLKDEPFLSLPSLLPPPSLRRGGPREHRVLNGDFSRLLVDEKRLKEEEEEAEAETEQHRSGGARISICISTLLFSHYLYFPFSYLVFYFILLIIIVETSTTTRSIGNKT